MAFIADCLRSPTRPRPLPKQSIHRPFHEYVGCNRVSSIAGTKLYIALDGSLAGEKPSYVLQQITTAEACCGTRWEVYGIKVKE